MTVYVAAPLCGEAREELAGSGGRAGAVRVRIACLPGAGGGGELDLARLGANARRASEDSSTVGYIVEPDPAASRFSGPILESASIPTLSNASGAAAMSQLLAALERSADSSNLRESLNEALQ